MNFKRVVITGIGTINPLGHNVKEFKDALFKGVSGSDLITRFDTTKFKTKFACEIKNYDVKNYFDRKEARKMDRYAQYAMIAAKEAIENSGILETNIDKEKVGVIWASGIGGLETFDEELMKFFTGDGTPRFSPFFIPKMIADIASGHISMKYGFMGPNFATVSACASSSHAIIDAYHLIKLGKADIIVAGGAEASITPSGIGGFNSMHAISTNNEEYKTASRPFSADRDGFVMGEGGAGLVLEDYEHAKSRGAKILGEIVGIGLSADAYHISAPHPEGKGAYSVMKQCIDEAGIDKSEVDYINVHGTATPIGDISEIKAILKLFGEDAYKLNISATKSMTGHLLGAAGAIEALATVLSIMYDIVPPTINHKVQDPEIDPKLNLTLHKAQKRKIKYAISNTFGFGGHNASIIFKKYED